MHKRQFLNKWLKLRNQALASLEKLQPYFPFFAHELTVPLRPSKGISLGRGATAGVAAALTSARRPRDPGPPSQRIP